MQPLAWVNIPVFDYKGIMRNDNAKKLYMWFVTDVDMLSDEMLNPIGKYIISSLLMSLKMVLIDIWLEFCSSSNTVAFHLDLNLSLY